MLASREESSVFKGQSTAPSKVGCERVEILGVFEGSFQFEEEEAEEAEKTVELDCGKRSFRMEGQAMRREFRMERMRFYWMSVRSIQNAIGCVNVV